MSLADIFISETTRANDSDPDGSKVAAKRAAKEARRKKKEAAK